MDDSILDRFKSIKVWKNQGKRAPHKPLLLLWALGKIQNGDTGPWSFKEVSSALMPLLREFAPSVKRPRPDYPFVKLCNDGIWTLSDRRLDTKKELSPRQLLDEHIHGSFSDDLKLAFRGDSQLISQLSSLLLAQHFPETYIEDLAQSCDLKYHTVTRVTRDPHFREKVLVAYGKQCAVCGYQVFQNQRLVGLEAAHIKWHNVGGPNTVNNGIALCNQHHILFDRGCFCIDMNFRVVVSPLVEGVSAENILYKYEGKQLHNGAIARPYLPELEFLNWHAEEVYKSYG